MIAAILVGRKGSESIKNKNIYPVLGRPLMYYPVSRMMDCNKIDEVYISTDCEEISRIGEELGACIIQRPEELCASDADFSKVVEHAVIKIAEIYSDLEYVVFSVCNCGMHRVGVVEECIDKLINDPEADSCVSGYFEEDHHPMRAKKHTDKYLETWLPMEKGVLSNRQDLPACFIVDHSNCVMRPERCIPVDDGQPPFRHLGKNVLACPQDFRARDVHTLEDINLTESFLMKEGWECKSLS